MMYLSKSSAQSYPPLLCQSSLLKLLVPFPPVSYTHLILQNPVKAGLVDKIEDYEWTNYNDYIGINRMTDTHFVLQFFDEIDKVNALKLFIEYVNKENGDECMDVNERRQPADHEAIRIIKNCCKINDEKDLLKLGKDVRNTYLRELIKKRCV